MCPSQESKASANPNSTLSVRASASSDGNYEGNSASEGSELGELDSSNDEPLIGRQRRPVFTTAEGQDLAIICELDAIRKLKDLALEAAITEKKKRIAERELEKAKKESAKMAEMQAMLAPLTGQECADMIKILNRESQEGLAIAMQELVEEKNETERLKLRNKELETEMA